jgi:hypothetical protein
VVLDLKSYIWLALILFLLISISPVLSHTPLQPDNNESLDTAMVIIDPTKSWAIYAKIHEKEEAQYYILHLDEGEKLKVSLYVPLAEKNFGPKLVVMGPEISSNDLPPGFIEVPKGVGVLIVESNLPESPEYEPFTPSSYYYISEFELEINEHGDYYLVVYETSRGGRYGLALGYREVFGVDEWLLVPIDIFGIREWEGQSLGVVLSPLLATLAGGFLVTILLNKKFLRILRFWTVTSAGLLYLGSGFMIILQMFIALLVVQVELSVILTLIFAIMPILLGLLIIRTRTREIFGIKIRILIAILGLLGFVTWSGLLIGPSLAILSSTLPEKRE